MGKNNGKKTTREKTTTSSMWVIDTDLPIAEGPAEKQSKIDLPIMAEGRSQNI